MPFWDSWIKPAREFKSGALKTPTKFKVVCTTCSGDVTLSIPPGYQEPSILLKCACGKAESLSVR